MTAIKAIKTKATKSVSDFKEIANQVQVQVENTNETMPQTTAPKTVVLTGNTKVIPKVTVGEAQVLGLLFLMQNPKSPLEELLAQNAAELFKEPSVLEAVETLKIKGYLDENSSPTGYGVKLVMVGTSPTPNFPQVAASSPNSAFAMVISASKALVETHGIIENGIKPGKDDKLCVALETAANSILDGLEKGGWFK